MNNMVFTFEVFDPSAIRVVEGCLATLRSCLPHALAEIRIQERRAHDADGTMTVNSKSSDEHYVFEAKTRIESSTLGMAVGRAKDYAQEAGARPLILAMYINDTIAGRISESGIDYIDSVGNISINSESVVVRSRGGKPPAKSERVQRAFQSSGLQVIAVLLAHPYAVNWTYRRLAEEAGVSLGSISHVLDDLRHAGYVKLVGPRQNRLMNRRDLFDKWEFAYASRVRPSLNPHRFRLADQAPLEQLYERIANSDEGILIGGELATAMAMKHLRPERATIHTPKGVALRKLQTLLKLVPDPEGYVEVIDRFEKGTSLRWPGPNYRALIHPLLVHAEIIRVGADDRLREAAREVFDKFIGPVLDDETVHQ